MAKFGINDILNAKTKAAGQQAQTEGYKEIYLSPYEVKAAQENTHQKLENIEELADSFLHVGQEQPTVLARVNGEYRIIDGHRRNAANILNLERGHKEYEKVLYRFMDMSEVQNMEQEETKTTAVAGAEMPPEAESWVQLHESELTELMQKQAKAAITELKRQEKQERKKEKYHNTFTLMKCYRDAVFHIENAISDGQQLELKGMTDEQQRTYLESIRRTRFKTLIMTAHIDKAVEEIERRRQAAGRDVEYKAFEMYFMQGMDYAEIAEELDTGKNTPRRWVTGIINELSVLLWGIDEERVK